MPPHTSQCSDTQRDRQTGRQTVPDTEICPAGRLSATLSGVVSRLELCGGADDGAAGCFINLRYSEPSERAKCSSTTCVELVSVGPTSTQTQYTGDHWQAIFLFLSPFSWHYTTIKQIHFTTPYSITSRMASMTGNNDIIHAVIAKASNTQCFTFKSSRRAQNRSRGDI